MKTFKETFKKLKVFEFFELNLSWVKFTFVSYKLKPKLFLRFYSCFIDNIRLSPSDTLPGLDFCPFSQPKLSAFPKSRKAQKHRAKGRAAAGNTIKK